MASKPTAAAEQTGESRCPVCRRLVNQRPRGRRRSYCSHACRQVAYRERKGDRRRRGLVKLIEADAREFLATIPDDSIDLIVTDPPYRFDRGQTYFREWFADLADDEWPAILRQLHRVLRQDAHAYVFCDPRTRPVFDAAAEAAGFRIRAPLIWDKLSIGLGGGAWRSQYEFIALYEKGSRSGNSRSRANVLRARRVRSGYPTEKPVSLLMQLLDQSSTSGEVILDPFCGSGNVGAAARRLGRRALLCDSAPGFAARRLRLTPTRD